MTQIRSFDDLSPGQEFDLGRFALPRQEVLDFAARYDAQPFHLDEEAARDSVFGELVASGLHTLSAAFGHMVRSGLIARVSMGGNAIDLKWPAPLRPDEEVAMRVVVEELRTSKSKPHLGIARLRYLVARVADGTVVLDALCTHFMRR
ncbi:MaoC/PaaZ C-terminal domain-containing protein [Falsiroseomonas sp. CW058]|uniref:MaoC/PaaZ C-terminal domain-containing protein n=1 Tax=Falsiroseomonas sp. CW058 TaxID=3388664 RepID=UPI003D31ADC8